MTAPTEPAARDLYDRWHSALGPGDEAGSPWHQLVWRHLDRERDLRVARALEIGCGRGGFTYWLAAQSPRPTEIVAADFSPAAVELAERESSARGVVGVRWVQADIQAIPFDDSSFDTVFSFETIEHVPDPPRAVRELARVLRPGGRLFLTTPNYLGMMGLYRGYLRVRGRRFTEVGQPINQFTTLLRTIGWVRRAGLRVAATSASGHYLPVPGRPPIRFRWLDAPQPLTKWFGLHSCVVAAKP
ncbi:MAG TPA: class I SAM-dependent methyltransferase [Fimbriiglobus sp.]|nr:class I SAM-dependent methyltransferase [Fimbriiglobus sp.]